MKENADLLSPLIGGQMTALGLDPALFLSFGLGVFTALLGVAAKYAMDYRLAKRRLEMDERAAITKTMGNGPGLLRRGSMRLRDRVQSCFRDAEHLELCLRPGQTPDQDGYFLRTFVQRMFVFFSLGDVVQSAIDGLSAKTLRARADLRQLYALIEMAKCGLTHIGIVKDFPGYVEDAEGYHLFIAALDDLADLGVAAYSNHDNTVPVTVFNEYYDAQQPTLMGCARGCRTQVRRTRRQPSSWRGLHAVLKAILKLPLAEAVHLASDTSLR